MTDSLSGLDVTKYIRYFWNARHGLVREKDLYREISATIKTPKDSAEDVYKRQELAWCRKWKACRISSSCFLI